MAVPARDIGRIKTRQGAGFDNEILQNFIDRVSDVQLAIGVRRPIVQNKLGFARSSPAHLAVQIHVLPLLQSLRLALGQVGLHRKIRLGQVQGTFVITHKL